MPSRPSIKTLALILAIVGFAGFLDASFLTVEHFAGKVPPCAVFTGCETVTTSRYATIGPVPVALLGSLYYLTVFILSVAYLDTKKESILRLAAFITPIGFLTSLWLVYLQLFIINAICLYCVISAITSTTLFITGMWTLKQTGTKKQSL